jgi:hypothetical protein
MGISGSKKSSVLSIELSSLCVKLAGSNVSSFFNRSLGHRWVLLIGWSLLSQTSFTPEWRRASVCCIDIYLAAILVVWTWGFVRHAKCAKTFQEKKQSSCAITRWIPQQPCTCWRSSHGRHSRTLSNNSKTNDQDTLLWKNFHYTCTVTLEPQMWRWDAHQ